MIHKKRNGLTPLQWHRLFLLLLFTAASIVFYFALPGEARFRFEYQKGRPWMHSTLYAPYNFAIIKSEQDIALEKDSVLQNQIPYFVLVDSITIHETAALRNKIEQLLSSKSKTSNQILSIRLRITELFSSIYSKGILDQTNQAKHTVEKKRSIKILKNNVSREVPVSSVYSLKSAYTEVLLKMDELKLIHPDWSDLLNQISPENYLTGNLRYDEEKNRQNELKNLDNISTNHGLVQEGERIVSQGDIVSPQTFNILESLRITYEKSRGENSKYILIVLGKILFILLLLLTLFLFLYNIRKKILRSKRDTSFIIITLTLMIFFCSLVLRYGTFDIYILPFTALALIIRTFIDARVAIYVNTIAALFIGFMVPNGYEFVLLQIPVGSIAVISQNKMQKREQLLITSLIIFVAYSAIFIGISLVQEGNLASIEWLKIKFFAFNAVLTLITYLLIFVLEKSFGFVSDVTLIELTYSNQTLLKMLSSEAPGTLHHSLQVANLSEQAINKIGGNALLVRAGSMYHDIGKISNPLYFTENQVAGINPHDQLSYEESAKIIISHVDKGVELARKYKLPEQLIDFIRTHHGTSKTGYFYQKAKNAAEGKEIDDRIYSYPGPYPKTKETAVVMLADSIEAASRSLTVKSPENIKIMIEAIFKQRIESGQLEYAPLTFRDIKLLKDLFLEKLINSYHVRVKYTENIH